jgi:membrane protease YdiL (CAAX protease family)
VSLAPPAAPSSYLDRARDGRGSGATYLLGLIAILVGWLVGGGVVAASLMLLLGGSDGLGAKVPWRGLVIDLLPFALLALAVLATVRWVLRRPAVSTITWRPSVSVPRMITGAALFGGLVLALSVVDAVMHPGTYRWSYDPATFWPAAIVVALLVPVQAGAEELLFRCYIVQWTSLGTERLSGVARTAALSTVSGLVFAIPHLANPEARGAQAYAWLVWFLLGAGWAWAAIADGRAELAIGAHIANNVVGILVAGYADAAVPTPSLWTTDVINWPSAIIGTAVIAALFVWLSGRGRRSQAGTS